MTELSQKILDNFQVRKTKQQKLRFAALLKEYIPQLKTEVSGFPKSRNLIIGDPESAQVLLSAHYDTCARLPFPNFITPKNPLLSILYSVLILLPAIALITIFSLALARYITDFWVAYTITLVLYAAVILLMLAGPANRHNANDNTSGVITLLEIYQALPEADRNKVAFLLFDNEEKGVLGSGQFRRKHKQLIKKALLINFDCVSDGDHILVGISKKANAKYRVPLSRAFTSRENKHVMLEKLHKIYYPSDQAGFPMAIAIAALKHRKFPGYYMDRIHTGKDVVFDTDNIAYLTDSTLQLLRNL